MKHIYLYQDKTFSLDITPTGKSYRATLGDKTVEVQILRSQDGRMDLLIDGQPVNACISQDGAKRWVTLNGQTLLLTGARQARKNTAHDDTHKGRSAGQLLAPMPGQVRAVQTAPGEMVRLGQTLVVVEAMKMEIKIAAPFDGRVKTMLVSVGQIVDREQLLLELEP